MKYPLGKSGRYRAVATVLVIIAAFAAGYLLRGEAEQPQIPPASMTIDQQAQVWTCSMHPQIRQPGPGQCPICGMDLIPVARESEKRELGPRELTLSPKARRLARIEEAPVERRFVSAEIRLVGKVAYDETRLSTISAWVAGRIDHLHVDFTGVFVKKGSPMVSLYSPELLTAQAELFQAIKGARDLGRSRIAGARETALQTVDAVREKLRLWGLTQGQIEEIERRGTPSDHITILAPASGVVVRKDAVEGMYVKTGTEIYTIADLSRVWVKLDAYESDLSWIMPGQEVEFRAEAFPGESFKGTVAFVDPFVDEKTRTVKVRVNAPNADGKLKPEMFVHALVRAEMAAGGKVITDPVGEAAPLVIPASAPLITGKRAVVYVAVPGQEGTYEGREVVLGPRAGDWYLVASGLAEGERVVVNGNFKIDSAAQILAKPSMMSHEGGGPAPGHAHHGPPETRPPSPAPEGGHGGHQTPSTRPPTEDHDRPHGTYQPALSHDAEGPEHGGDRHE
jgi:Cu(I)/Ag(I) efflux system membrane fusion protein